MRRVVWFISLLCMPFMANAQHFFELGIRGGMAGWNARTYYVNAVPNLHVGLELAYHYVSPQVVGFRTAITLDRHQASFAKHDYTDSYQIIDLDNQLMQIDYTIGSLQEQYVFWSVGIPLQLTFTWDNISLSVGPKIVFPLQASWHETAKQAALSVYYPDYDNRIYDSYPLAASQDFSMQQKGSLSMPKIQWWLASELTYNLPLNSIHNTSHIIHHTSYLTFGVYVDYAFSDVPFELNDTKSLIMLTDTRDGFPLQRILSPVLTSSHSSSTVHSALSTLYSPLITRCSLFDVGIKVAYTFSPYNPSRSSARKCHCW